MIGNRLADQRRYPRLRVTGVLAALRLQNRSLRVLHRLLPSLGQRHRARQFEVMPSVSHHSDAGISYRLPEHLHAERDVPL